MADYKTTDLLNAIRNGASTEYKDRIPTATQTNMSQVGSAILDYTPTRNEFVNALLNRIAMVVVKNRLFENPLKEFKKGTLEWGKSIEEVFVDLVKGENFDSAGAESTLFKRNIPDIKSVFHILNRQNTYTTTVENAQLKQAFLSADGFNSLIEKIIQTLYTSDNYDEFLLMKNLIHTNGVEGKFQMYSVTPVTDEATAKAALSIIKEVSNDMTFMSDKFNHAGVKTSTPKNEQIVLINTKFDARVDVEVLASAFNMDKADFIGRRVLVDDFGGLSNVLCALVDKDWFMVYDNLFTTEDIYNPKGLYYNYFLHHWQTLSTSPFANAVLFVTVAPTLESINLYPATKTVSKGETIQFTVETVGTGNPPSKVVYTHDGTDTTISTTGFMVVGKNETKEAITVTATSTFDEDISDTATITIA